MAASIYLYIYGTMMMITIHIEQGYLFHRPFNRPSNYPLRLKHLMAPGNDLDTSQHVSFLLRYLVDTLQDGCKILKSKEPVTWQ